VPRFGGTTVFAAADHRPVPGAQTWESPTTLMPLEITLAGALKGER